jgi:hypothetical protein
VIDLRKIVEMIEVLGEFQVLVVLAKSLIEKQ